MTTPQLVAHRGYPEHYPENTLVGFDAAIRAGARFIETDIQLSSDQVPVLFHDRDLKRLCDVTGAVHDYTYAELQKFRASEPTRFSDRFQDTPIATLAELSQLLKKNSNVTAFIELKRSSLKRFGVDATLSAVKQKLNPILEQSVLISYELEALLAARRQGWAQIGVVIDYWDEHTQKIISEIGPQYLFCDVDGLPRAGGLKHQNARLAVFEITDPAQAMTLAARGIELIETFAVGEMLAQLQRLAR